MITKFAHLPCQIHGTCIAVHNRGLLLLGSSGAGKSALALQLLALGADLVADDRCDLSAGPLGVVVQRPENLPEAIEARGLGILNSPCVGPTPLVAVLDLDRTETDRVPRRQIVRIGSHDLPLLRNSAAPHMAAALLHFLKYGFHASMEE